jgi:uncharacterized membrane protein
MTPSVTRRTYLDVLRGVAVLLMIEAHVIDSWTTSAEHQSHWFRQSMVLGGFAAPLFLFFAGVAVSLSAASKARRLGDVRAAMRAVQKRGLEIFALALLFRLQSKILSNGPWWTLLKVDILNIMGPSITAAATLWGLARSPGARMAAFGVAMAGMVWFAPAVRGFDALALLPDAIEAYFRPVPGLSNFTLFPWAAFVAAGALMGVILDEARLPQSDRRANLAFAAGGLVLAYAAYRASFLPPLDERSRFWSTSASFFFVRLGLMVAAVGGAWLWEHRPSLRLRPEQALLRGSGPAAGKDSGAAPGQGSGQPTGRPWSPLQVLGRSSLFVYWIHVELVYGLVSLPLHGAFSLAGAWAALGAFSLLMLAAAVAKDWTIGKFKPGNTLRNQPGRAAQPLMF